MKTKVFIADDHRIIVDGISALFKNDVDIEVVGHAFSTNDALDLLKVCDYDVLILDIRFSQMIDLEDDGFFVLKQVREWHPNRKVIMLTSHEEPGYVQLAMELGANGYLLKTSGKTEIRNAVQAVMAGNFYLAGKVASSMLNAVYTDTLPSPELEISARELEVIQLICNQLTTEEIADKLNVQLSTIKTHRKNILAKLKVRNVAGIVRYAIENKLID